MITVDGESVTPGSDASDDEAETVRLVRLDLKLCKALVALNPPHELSVLLHARMAGQLRTLRRRNAADQDTRQAADLDDDELSQAAAIIKAIRALPSWSNKALMGTAGFRSILSDYALDIADEIDGRGRDKS